MKRIRAMDVGRTKVLSAMIVLFSMLAWGGAVRSQQDCRKGAGGGKPPWFNPGKSCKFQQHTFIFAGTVGWPQRTPPETDCYVRIKVCGLDLKQNTVNPLGTICPSRSDFAQPIVCCDEFNKAVASKQPCDPMQDADCDGVPNDKDPDPLKPDQKYGEKGFVYASMVSGSVHQEPSADSPVVSTVPHGSRILFTAIKEMNGSLWYYVPDRGQPSGWIAAGEVSCDRPPPLPPGKHFKIEDLYNNTHPGTAMTTSARG